MMRRTAVGRTGVVAGVVLGLAGAVAAGGQEKGNWRPMSSTARAITGPIVIANERLTINFAGFALAEIRELKPAEVAAAFDGAATGRGHLFRLSIPGDKQFLHKNTMCGGEETQWMVSNVDGKTLELAFFSGSQMPVLVAEQIANSTALCGTYSYTR